jgi:hypothetical protein
MYGRKGKFQIYNKNYGFFLSRGDVPAESDALYTAAAN